MTQIGPYRIIRELGRGAMGVVYLAQDPVIDRLVAIKTIQLDPTYSEEQRTDLIQRFQREARAAGALSHPNVAVIYFAGIDQDLPYIAMEFVDGQPMEQLFTSAAPWDGPALNGLLQIAKALDYAHSRGVIHRDVKPGNILVGKTGEFKIVDFGIAKVISETLLTTAGAAIGTPSYMSPEQLNGAAIDGRSDQFALAVIAYRVLTGNMPFAGSSPVVICFQIMQDDPASPSSVNSKWSADVDSVMKRALAKEPVRRYATCEEFIVALLAATSAAPERFVSARRYEHPPPGDFPVKVWLLTAAGVVLLVVLAALLLVWKKTRSSVPAPLQTGKASVVTTVEVNNRPLPSGGRPVRLNSRDRLYYAWIPSGSFEMGCKESVCANTYLLAHDVEITQAFWLGQTAVTVGSYRRYIHFSNGAMPPAPAPWSDWQDAQQPMSNVTWYEASAFCTWGGGRLPTEAEWEYAGRAGTTGITYGDPGKIAWYGASKADAAPEVGLKQPNAFALYDMLGGVRQWVADAYSEDYYLKRPVMDPKGPTDVSNSRVVRGSAWTDKKTFVNIALRGHDTPDQRRPEVGFRCATTILGTP